MSVSKNIVQKRCDRVNSSWACSFNE